MTCLAACRFKVALSVHRAQLSDFDEVIIVMSPHSGISSYTLEHVRRPVGSNCTTSRRPRGNVDIPRRQSGRLLNTRRRRGRLGQRTAMRGRKPNIWTYNKKKTRNVLSQCTGILGVRIAFTEKEKCSLLFYVHAKTGKPNENK